MSIVSTKLDEISSTKSDILFFMRVAPKEFTDWLSTEMNHRNWGVRDTAQRAGLSHPTISDILTNGKQPSLDTVIALARTFNKSPVYLARLAKLLPEESGISPVMEEMLHLLGQLDPDDQEELIKIARMKLESPKGDPSKQTSRGKRPARNALKDQ